MRQGTAPQSPKYQILKSALWNEVKVKLFWQDKRWTMLNITNSIRQSVIHTTDFVRESTDRRGPCWTKIQLKVETSNHLHGAEKRRVGRGGRLEMVETFTWAAYPCESCHCAGVHCSAGACVSDVGIAEYSGVCDTDVECFIQVW